MRDFLSRISILPFLDRTGLRRPLGRLWRIVRYPETLNHEWALRQDYRVFKRRYGAILAEGARSADPNRRVLIVSLTNWVWQVKLESLLAKALQLRGYTPVILTYRWYRDVFKYYQIYGIDEFVFFDDYISHPVPAEIAQSARTALANAHSIQAIKNLQYRGVSVGRQVLASITRGLHRSVQVTDPKFRDLLERSLPEAMQGVPAAEAIMDRVQPATTLFLDKDYTGIGAIFDLSINRGVNTIQWCGSLRDDAYTLKRYTAETRNFHPQSLSEQSWAHVKQMTWTERHERVLLQDFADRYQTGKWASYYNHPYGTFKSKEAIRTELGLDPRKKTAVIFSHILWDSTFFWGEDLFDDYAEWLIETVRAACANPAVNWIVKLHPANAWKLKRDGIQGELYDYIILREKVGELPEHVKILDPEADLNTFALFDVTDYCLTVRGTIGIEMSCFGIPVLTAGTGRYSGLDFTVDSATRAEYLERLANIQDIPRLTPEQTALAKKYAYALFALRPWQFKTFETVYLPLRNGGHPLDHNLVIHANSSSDIANAPDLNAFADWAIHSRAADYMVADDGASPQ